MNEPSETLRKNTWYECDIPKKELNSYMKRSNTPAALHIGLWLVLLIGTGVLSSVFFLQGNLWCILTFAIYGVLYSAADARTHETVHGTPFKTSWINTAVCWFAALIDLMNPVIWRWSHSRHHSWTMHKGDDPEISVPRPPNVFLIALEFFHLHKVWYKLAYMFAHALGIKTKLAKMVVPEDEMHNLFWAARVNVLVLTAVIVATVLSQSILPFLLYGLPRIYGGYIQWMMILLQHAGLEEDVWDHRLVCRTVIMNPVFGFLYMNMQYHTEHHLYPLIPFHALPAFHQRVKSQLPQTYPNLWSAYKDLIPVLLRQRKQTDFFLVRELPMVQTQGVQE